MTRFHTMRATGLFVVVLALGLAGCSKKAAEAPPETTPAVAESPPPDTSSAPSTPETPTPSTGSEQIQWRDAFFDYDQADLRSDAREALDADAKLLRDNAGARILIEGHADERGTTEYNLALGERRAAAARDYLVAAGIDNGRIDIISYGEERPFATGTTEEAYQQNRRAHLVSR